MKYAVTFCVMDGDVGANPMGHSCLLLSQWDETDRESKMEVVERWGFYGLPTTTADSWTRKIKLKIGLDVDLQGNHGKLISEKYRNFDTGVGLKGTTFELTEDKFRLLQQKCQAMINDQEAAIREFGEDRNLEKKPDNEVRIYPYEHESTHIFALEKSKARNEHREPRLKPFKLDLSVTLAGGISMNNSNTCKSQALSLLDEILTPEQIARLTEQGKHKAIPRYSGPVEKLIFHSEGPLRTYTKKNGKKVYYRDNKDEEVKLYWTVPPHDIVHLPGSSFPRARLNHKDVNGVKLLASQLQQLEWLFRNAVFADDKKADQERLINNLISIYNSFSPVKPHNSASQLMNASQGHLFFHERPKNADEREMRVKIGRAKGLINDLFMSSQGDFPESLIPLEMNGGQDFEKKSTVFSDEGYEGLARALSKSEKKQLANIVSKSFTKPEHCEGDLYAQTLKLV